MEESVDGRCEGMIRRLCVSLDIFHLLFYYLRFTVLVMRDDCLLDAPSNGLHVYLLRIFVFLGYLYRSVGEYVYICSVIVVLYNIL